MYQDKFEVECKRVKKEIVGTYTFQGVPLLEIVDLEKVAEAHSSEVRGSGSSFRGPSLMDLGPKEGSSSHVPQMSGNGGHPITREPSASHFLTSSTHLIVGKHVPMVTRLVLSSEP